MNKPISMKDFILQIPKAELHLHIEGTLEPELMFELAHRNQIKLPYSSIEQAKKAYNFTNLQSFLDIYYTGANVLIHEKDFYDLTWAYMLNAKKQNIRHCEIFFDPQTHLNRNIAFETFIKGIHAALQDAKQKLGVSSKLIMCFLRNLSEQDAQITLNLAMPFKDWITGVGLDSSEVGNPPKKFKNVFARARDLGFLTCCHAGEEGPPEYIWEALEILKVQRIDHGVHCVLDEKLIKELAKSQIPLTVCPLSNTKLKVYPHMKDHPLKEMLDANLCAVVNSDDPAYFDGYVAENFLAVQQSLNLTHQDIYQLAKNSFLASFLDKDQKQNFLNELDNFMEANSFNNSAIRSVNSVLNMN